MRGLLHPSKKKQGKDSKLRLNSNFLENTSWLVISPTPWIHVGHFRVALCLCQKASLCETMCCAYISKKIKQIKDSFWNSGTRYIVPWKSHINTTFILSQARELGGYLHSPHTQICSWVVKHWTLWANKNGLKYFCCLTFNACCN